MDFALQLYSLRDEMAADHVGTIKKVAAMGYKNVEFAGYFGETGQSMKALLDSVGMKAVSSHVGYGCYTGNFAGEVEFNHAVGNNSIILPWFNIQNIEDAKAAVDKIAAMREAFVKEGFEFGYHNHAFEFKPLDDNGTCAMDFLKTIDGLKFQPDVFWIKTAGLDPIEFINNSPIISVHMKEYRADGFNVELGNGMLPWQDIMAAAQKKGVSLGIVEQEEYTCAPIDSVKICIDNIKKIFG